MQVEVCRGDGLGQWLGRIAVFLGMILWALPAWAQESGTEVASGSVIADFGAQPVYAEPDDSSGVLSYLMAGTPLRLHARTSDEVWLQVSAEATERTLAVTGWMWRSLVTTQTDIGLLPVEAIPPQTVLDTLLIYNVTPFAAQIFAYGQTIGNRADFFSKIGDSITVNTNYLTPLGFGIYNLAGYTQLERVITHYNIGAYNAFLAESNAAQTSWTTNSLLEPFEISSGSCNRGESPLECEYRVHQPAIALIMIGTNDAVVVDADAYRANLARIVEISLDRGVLPILSTIPPLRRDPERARYYNLIIIEVASQYQVPLMNYWLAMRDLPEMGLTFDGVHPSTPPFEGGAVAFTPENLQYGYTVRNLLTLQTLDVVLSAVLWDA